MDPAGACCDCRQHHVPGRHREVIGVMLADSEEVDSYLLRPDAFGDRIADRLGMGDRLTVGVAVAVPEGVETEDEREPCWLGIGDALRSHLIRCLAGHVNTSCLDCASA